MDVFLRWKRTRPHRRNRVATLESRITEVERRMFIASYEAYARNERQEREATSMPHSITINKQPWTEWPWSVLSSSTGTDNSGEAHYSTVYPAKDDQDFVKGTPYLIPISVMSTALEIGAGFGARWTG